MDKLAQATKETTEQLEILKALASEITDTLRVLKSKDIEVSGALPSSREYTEMKTELSSITDDLRAVVDIVRANRRASRTSKAGAILQTPYARK